MVGIRTSVEESIVFTELRLIRIVCIELRKNRQNILYQKEVI